MGINKDERKQLVNTLHNYVERAYNHDQSYREFLDNLIDLYSDVGSDGMGITDKDTFLELIEEAL